MPRFLISLFLLLQATSLLSFAQQPKVLAIKEFTRIYPASSSLQIPFNGCLDLDEALPEGDGEYWLSVDHLVEEEDFHKMQVLVNSDGTIIGARAVFARSREEWHGPHGYESRKHLLRVHLGGDGPELSRKLPLAHDGSDFGGMVYTFDVWGNVSWRIAQGVPVTSEADYVRQQKQHSEQCEECKDLSPEANVLLPRPLPPEEATEEPM